MDAACGDQELTGGSSINPEGILEESSRSFANGAALEPKVRKPYTISKQRERWTEEEHQRFLDALQLHGRSWCKIEEHVGTKTTVQIRSHAQKFFSKVTREANCEFEIPPPRPKRKPDHPYPRKLDHPHRKRTQIQGQLKVSSSLQSSNAFEEDNISPTSVITLHQSENEAASNELENQNQSKVSGKKDGNFLSLGSLNYDGIKTENKSTIQESNLKFEDSKKTVQTFRLLGKTVIMSDSDKQALEDDHIAPDIVKRNPQGSSGLDAGNPSQSIQNAYPSDLDPANPSQSIQNACQVGVLPTIQCLPPYEGQARMILVPQWAFCWNLPFPTGHESRFVLSHCFPNSVHLCFAAVISVLRIKHTPSLRCRVRVSVGTLVPYTRLSCTFSITEGLKCSSYREGTAQPSVRNECSNADTNPAPERGSVFDPQYRDHNSETKVNTIRKAVAEHKSAFVPYKKRQVEESTTPSEKKMGQ